MIRLFHTAIHSLVWWAPWSLAVLAVMPQPYTCWLAEHHLFRAWGEWVAEQPWCLQPPPVSEAQVLLPLWGVPLVPLAALASTLWCRARRAWPVALRVSVSAVGVWLYLALPLYFFWLAGKS